MSKTIAELLDQKIPRDVISSRDGGGGRQLSYLEGYYVIDRLNQIFGPLGWEKQILSVLPQEYEKTVKAGNDTKVVRVRAYLVHLRLTVRDLSKLEPHGSYNSCTKEAYGYGSDKPDRYGNVNNPGELAMKEAVTDALKVAAKDLGMSMGLALYDKSQEFVDDSNGTETEEKKPTERVAPNEQESKREDKASETPQAGDSDKLRKYIGSAAKIAVKKGHTPEQIKAGLKTLTGVTQLDQVSDSQLVEVKKYIDSLI